MAKSMRCKREKRLRAIRREIVAPFYDNKDAAKLAAQEAALAAPKLPVRHTPKSTSMELVTTNDTTNNNNMDVEMQVVDGDQSKGSLKPVGGIGKKSKRKFKVGKGKHRGKGKIKIKGKRHI
ncbi:hypothetical protein CFOL_v3_23556 [Cephalotus follicularis]|uniref:Uncharacterized protein n=1 Tax=Cephalotus follicularis TaxID=3775 RepID=A0A1Q3CIK4_CEPFO|nr:hypothetical protein CFOL_v3_23556 [Cephalotus follicularis]